MSFDPNQQQQQAYLTYSVEIPAGVNPGGQFRLDHGGMSYTLVAPPGSTPGGLMQAQLPALPQHALAAQQQQQMLLQQQQMLQRQQQAQQMQQQQQQQQQMQRMMMAQIMLAQQQQQQAQQTPAAEQPAQPHEWVALQEPTSGKVFYRNNLPGETRWAQ